MADEYVDNSGNTEQFRAFVQSVAPDQAPTSRTPLLIGVAVAVVLVLALVVYLVS